VLSEIEQLADDVGIIHAGRLLFQGELASLKARNEGTLEDIFLRLTASGDEVT
jgi:ABC-2 type transport system ATP-binding protein